MAPDVVVVSGNTSMIHTTDNDNIWRVDTYGHIPIPEDSKTQYEQ